jgi:DNA-binding transcriptional MerR regulator
VGYRGPQVCAIVGITYRQLDYWARTGLLRPSVVDAHGSGTQRLYSYRDLVELKVVKQLLDGGVSLQRARKAVECLRSSLGVDVAAASLVLAGTSSVLAHSDGEVVDLLRGGQGVLNIVPLAGVVGELHAAIHELDASASAVASASSPVAATDGPDAAATGELPAKRDRTAAARDRRPAVGADHAGQPKSA